MNFRRAIDLDPNYAEARAFYSGPLLTGLGVALHHTGRYKEVLDHERMRAARRGDRELEDALTLGYAQGGYQVAMRRAGDILAARSTRDRNEFSIARFYLFAGENDRALDLLERAYEARDPNLPSISQNPDVDPLRGNPRFQALLQRMNRPS